MKIQLTEHPKTKPALEDIRFGPEPTDHLFIVNYERTAGWRSPRIIPYQHLGLDPTAVVLHYGLSIFEGLKIFKQPDGSLAAFRPLCNAKRLNRSAQMMSMPTLPVDLFVEGLTELTKADRDWAPASGEHALYARPVMFASEATLGVSPANEYTFFILLMPVRPHYSEGQPGHRLLVDEKYDRSSRFSVAAAKTSGNYAKMIRPLYDARREGYDGILWVGGENGNFIEEAGITNIFIVTDSEVLTPPLNGQILPGITRESVISLLRERGYEVEEREIDIRALCDEIDSGAIREIFLTGTATLIAPVQSVTFHGQEHVLAHEPATTMALYRELTGIQYGRLPDKFGWRYSIC